MFIFTENVQFYNCACRPIFVKYFSMNPGEAIEPTREKSPFGSLYKWEVLFLLWGAFFINQADRQIYNTLIGDISSSLGLTSAEAGFIATMFGWIMAVLCPVAGIIADRHSKKWIIFFSIALWSAATMVSGACTGLAGFLIFRSAATGVGESFFGPANYATIGEHHGPKTRALAMSIHQTSYYLGVIASGAIAGYIADRWGWRCAFYCFGAVGVFWAAYILLRLRDMPRPANLAGRGAENPPFAEAIKAVFKSKTAVCLIISFSGLIFVLQGYLTWSTLYLREKFAGISTAEAGFNSMFYTHASALAGVVIAGWISDRIAARRRRNRILLQGAGLLAASPFIVMMGMSETMAAVYCGFAGFGFFRAFFDANTYSVLYDVVPKKFHASAAGIMIAIGFGIGSFSPWILGHLKPVLGLSAGISSLSIVWILLSLLLAAAFKFFYEDDCAAADKVNLNQ